MASMFRCLDEQAYRFNDGQLTDAERFSEAVGGVVGNRVNWNQVTGKQAGEQTEVNREGSKA